MKNLNIKFGFVFAYFYHFYVFFCILLHCIFNLRIIIKCLKVLRFAINIEKYWKKHCVWSEVKVLNNEIVFQWWDIFKVRSHVNVLRKCVLVWVWDFILYFVGEASFFFMKFYENHKKFSTNCFFFRAYSLLH